MWHIFWRGYSRLRSGREHWAWMVVVEVRQGTLGGDTRGWGPAGNTGRGWSWLRSGREHWAWMVVVEVRQGTLGVDGHGWGPAGNTWHGYSRLRSGREHWAWMVVVEVRQRTLWIAGRSWTRRTTRRRGDEEERRGEEEQATDIKSNNPHLAGGEKGPRAQISSATPARRVRDPKSWTLRPLLLPPPNAGDVSKPAAFHPTAPWWLPRRWSEAMWHRCLDRTRAQDPWR